MIVISSFDPVRRQVARLALENLILDGRIQPAKIEEMVTKAQEDINKIIKQKGEEAVFECGIFNLIHAYRYHSVVVLPNKLWTKRTPALDRDGTHRWYAR
jgi:hypothetical protein